MTTLVLPQSADSEPGGRGGIRLAVATALTVWLLLVLSFGAAGAFVAAPGTPPLPIAIGVAAPLVLFFASLRLSQSFREFVLSLDLRLIAGIQAWRWAGLGFLDLYAYKVLPAVFALPAGLGDMAIGVTAPWIILALVRQPGFAASGTFIRWNVLGILDLIIAAGIKTREYLLQSPRGHKRDRYRSDGDAAAAADPGIPRAVIPHASTPSGGEREPETYPQPSIGGMGQGALPLVGQRPPRTRRSDAP